MVQGSQGQGTDTISGKGCSLFPRGAHGNIQKGKAFLIGLNPLLWSSALMT